MKPKFLTTLLASLLLAVSALAQSVSLSTDRARVTVASMPDFYGGPNLKVLRTDTNTPLRARTATIWEKQGQEEPASYYVSMRSKGLNSVRMILFDTWEVEAYVPGPNFTPTDWNDPVYRTRQLARMERSVNYASANGMYVIINSHNKIPNYNESYVNALWTWVAPYFANRTHVLYELANEPMSGIGANGDMDVGNALNSPRLQALRRGYNIARAGAPDTHLMILTPPGINDAAYGTGMGNLAASFAALPGVAVDWTKTSVAYHLYGNDAAYGAANNAANLRNLHSRYPGWPSENAFPPGDFPGAIGLDQWRSQPFPGDNWVNQTCERLGLGWSMWFMGGQTQLDTNFPIMWADAIANKWTWTPDVLPSPTLPLAPVSPTVDGALDTPWAAASPRPIAIPVLGSVVPSSDLSGTWRAMWDAAGLYVFAEVTDNILINDSGTAWYEDDNFEVYIDANNSKGGSFDGVNDYQYVFRWNTATVLEDKLNRTYGVVFARTATATGYRIEIKFPWSTLGVTPSYGHTVGLEIMLTDDDNGGPRERKLAWYGPTDNAYQNPGLFGTVRLAPVPHSITASVASSADDAEESLATGSVSLTGDDLEIVNDVSGPAGLQSVGLRFTGLALPPGATIVDARLQFTADESQSGAASLTVAAQAVNSAAAFTATVGNITNRSLTATSVAWQPAAWVAGAVGTAQQSPNLAAIVQEVVDRSGWVRGNALAIVINGIGHRTADSFDQSGGTPAQLTLTYFVEASPTSFARWMSNHSTLTGSQTLAMADPDFDGLNNLMEYALGTPPNGANTAGMTAGLNSDGFVLTYSRPTLTPDISYQVEWSETLAPANWSTANVKQTIINDNGLTRTMRAVVPIGTNAKGFLRLKVTQRP